MIDCDAAEGQGRGAVHSQQELRLESGAGGDVPGVEQGQPNEAAGVVIDQRFVCDPPFAGVAQAAPPMRIILKAQIDVPVTLRRDPAALPDFTKMVEVL